jgi:hypothetical protein
MKFAFWEGWPSPLKHIFYVFFVLFASAIIYTIVCSILGYQLVIDWEVVGQRLPVQITIKELNFGAFAIPLQSENYVINQWYQGSDMAVNYFAFYFFLIVVILAMILGLTSATFLGKIWYYGLTILFVGSLIFFKFDTILLFGLDDNTALILIIVSYLGLSYFFYTVRTDFDFWQRFRLFLGVTFSWVVIIMFFAEVDRPFMMLGSNGFLIPFLIGIIFIFSVSHEIIHFIVVALTKKGRPTGNNLTHFTMFSLLYLANVLILFLYDTHVIDWNFPYLNPYVLLAISAMLGLWGMQSRATLFDLNIKMYPLLVYVYFAAALCAFGTIFFFLGNANDSILQVVKDAIIYSHLGFGSIFFIYVIANFMGMLRGNLKVYQVIYKPRNMPHFIFRFAGLILVTAFFLKENIETSVYHTLSGMFNSRGDYYKAVNDPLNAETFYSNGGLYGYMNHKSNYSLAKISESKNDQVEALIFYKNSTEVRPSEMAFVNLANLNMGIGDFFNSLFTLNDGLRKFPAGKAILNNKGRLFSKTNILDSALLYFDASARADPSKKVSVVNYLALLSTYDYGFNADSLIDHYGGKNIDAMMANSIVIKNRRDQVYNLIEGDFEKLGLNIYSASSQTNYLLNQYRFYDSSFVSRREESVNVPANYNYKESMEYAIAMASYKRGYVDEAIRLLRNIAVYSGKSDIYNYQIGLILMDLGDFRQAIDYLDIAAAAGNLRSVFARQICEIELGIFNTETLSNESGGVFNVDSTGSIHVINLLSLNTIDLDSLEDQDKYLFFHYKGANLEISDQLLILGSIEDIRIRTGALLELFEKSFKVGHVETAQRCLVELESASVMDQQLNHRILEARLDYAAYINDTKLVEDLLNQIEWLSFDKRWYFEALIATKKGNEEDMVNYFQALAKMNSFNEESVIAAAAFFQNDEDPLRSYNILVNASLQNPYSVKLLKEYIKESKDQGLVSYAAQAAEVLQQLIINEEYEEFINSLSLQ